MTLALLAEDMCSHGHSAFCNSQPPLALLSPITETLRLTAVSLSKERDFLGIPSVYCPDFWFNLLSDSRVPLYTLPLNCSVACTHFSVVIYSFRLSRDQKQSAEMKAHVSRACQGSVGHGLPCFLRPTRATCSEGEDSDVSIQNSSSEPGSEQPSSPGSTDANKGAPREAARPRETTQTPAPGQPSGPGERAQRWSLGAQRPFCPDTRRVSQGAGLHSG